MPKEKESLSSYLTILMLHVIKWKSQPKKRTPSWLRSIDYARKEIDAIQKEKPSLTNHVIAGLWEKAFSAGKKEAEKDMKMPTDIESLTWKEVFEEKYELPDNYWKIWTVLLSIALLVWVLNK